MRNVVDIAGPEDLAPGLSPALFKKFADLAYHHAGITLKTGKESLVSSRVRRRTVALKLTGPEAYLEFLEQDGSGREIAHFLDAISTNVTSFFRESEHFQMLAERFAEKKREGVRRMRFWSAASSSGEEPYTLAMIAQEVLGDEVDWRILGTDISTQVLTRAHNGVYAEQTVDPVPAPLRQKYLSRTQDDPRSEALYQVSDKLRQKLVFRRLNLSQPPFPMQGPFDVILCRNVMIYFDDRVRTGIVREAHRLLSPGGLFITSHTETLATIPHTLETIKPSIYRRRAA
jgi:chemotaxis protein methyltransferase CheR